MRIEKEGGERIEKTNSRSFGDHLIFIRVCSYSRKN